MSNIIQLADHIPHFTGSELRAEARLNKKHSANQASIEEFVLELPEYLSFVLDSVMENIDYAKMKETDIAVAMRCLAVITNTLEDRLQEISN